MKYRVQRATGAGVVNMIIAPGVAWQLESIRIHLSAAGAATDLTATVDGGTTADVYDVVIATQAMGGVTDYVYKPDFPIPFGPDDELDIAYANGGGATYGIEVYYQGI